MPKSQNFFIKHRHKFYLGIFAAIGVFDFTTTLGSWALESVTGLIDQGGGFPIDYTVGMISTGLFVLTIYSLMKNKVGEISKSLEFFLGTTALLCLIFIGLMLVMFLALVGSTG